MKKIFAAAALAACAGGCATLGGPDEAHSTLDKQIDEKLSEFCTIPDGSVAQQHLLRAKVVLAAVAGYGLRSIQSYSTPTENKDDAQRLVGRIEEAHRAIDQAEAKAGQFLFPVYRADMLIELAEAAESAVRPTLREAKGFVLASGVDRIKRLKTAYLNLLADTLYLQAFRESCRLLKGGASLAAEMQAAKDRLKLRCDDVASLVAANKKCSIP